MKILSEEKLTQEEIGETREEKPGETKETLGQSIGKPDVFQDLEQQLQAKNEELEQLNQRFLRLSADFANFRKRSSLEITDIRRYAAENLVQDLLPVLDNFERALDSAHDLPENIFTGINMIYRQFLHVLQEKGLQQIDAAGKQFDPAFHDAFEQVETQDQANGVIIEEIQKGYRLHQKVLRPALVRVAKNSKQNSLETNTIVQEKEEGKNE